MRELAKTYDCGYSVAVSAQSVDQVDEAMRVVREFFPAAAIVTNKKETVARCGLDAEMNIVPKMCRALEERHITYRLRVANLKDVFLELIDK